MSPLLEHLIDRARPLQTRPIQNAHDPVPDGVFFVDQITRGVNPDPEEPFHFPAPVEKDRDLQGFLGQKPPNGLRVFFAVDPIKD
jgi:hypothetical protein